MEIVLDRNLDWKPGWDAYSCVFYNGRPWHSHEATSYISCTGMTGNYLFVPKNAIPGVRIDAVRGMHLDRPIGVFTGHGSDPEAWKVVDAPSYLNAWMEFRWEKTDTAPKRPTCEFEAAVWAAARDRSFWNRYRAAGECRLSHGEMTYLAGVFCYLLLRMTPSGDIVAIPARDGAMVILNGMAVDITRHPDDVPRLGEVVAEVLAAGNYGPAAKEIVPLLKRREVLNWACPSFYDDGMTSRERYAAIRWLIRTARRMGGSISLEEAAAAIDAASRPELRLAA